MCATNSAGDSSYASTSAATPIAPPAAPSGFTATAVSTAQINLAWIDNSANETGFKVSRGMSASGPWTQIAAPAANAASYSDKGLTAGTTYYYRVCATNSAGDSSCATANATTLALVPQAPSGLTATAVSSSRIDLAWTDNSSNETGFKINRGTSASGPWTPLSLGANVTTYSSTGLNASTTYYYQVCATNGTGDSACVSANATTLGPPPAAPSGLQAVAVSSSQINLSWTDKSDNETCFRLERAPTSAGTWTQIAEVAANMTAYSDTGLSSSTKYYYRVRACSAAGCSTYSSTTSTSFAITLGGAPAAPSSVVATAKSTTEIDVSWTDNSSNEQWFVVTRSGGAWSDVTTWIPTPRTSFTDTNLVAGTTYTYAVCATNSYGEACALKTASATTQSPAPVDPLVAPTNLQVEAISGSEIQVRWTYEPLQNVEFIVEMSPATDSDFSKQVYTGSNNSCLVSGLGEHSLYYFRVRARSDARESEYSGIVSTTTLLNTPTGLKATPGDFNYDTGRWQVEICWMDNSLHESSYHIERSTVSADGPWEPLGDVGANITTYQDNGCLPKQVYHYRVTAIGSNSQAGVCSTDELPEPPPVAPDPINLQWIGKTPVIGEAYGLAMSEDCRYAYVTSSTGFQIVDISDRTNPLVKSSLDLTYGYDVAVDSSGFAYVGDSKSLKVIDVAMPTAPVVVANVDLTDYALGVHVSGGKLYVANYLKGLRIVDISDPLLPRLLDGVADTPGQACAVSVYGLTAVVADGSGGVATVDVSDALAPRLLGSLPTSDTARDVSVTADGRAYVAAQYAGLLAVDVRVPAVPRLLSQSLQKDCAIGVAIMDNKAYLANFSYANVANGLQVFDVSGEIPQELGFVPVAGRNRGGVAVAGRVACVAAGYGGLAIVDVLDLAKSEPVGVIPQITWSVGLEVSESTMYTFGRSGISSSLYVYDVSSPESPEHIGSLRLTHPVDIALAGCYAVVADDRNVHMVDVSDPRHPAIVDTLLMPDYVTGVSISGGKVYAACYLAGLVVVDISDPYSLRIVGSVDTPGQAFAIALSGTTAIIADGTCGVALVNIANPCSPQWLMSLATSDSTRDIAVDAAGFAYVAAGNSGILLIDVHNASLPNILSAVPSRDTALGVCAGDGYAFSASFSRVYTANGLQAVDFSGGSLASEAFFLPSYEDSVYGGYCRSVATQGRMVFLTDDKYLARIAKY